MKTPLFPAHNAPISLRQGAVGDCYLLAALDCIFNSLDGGYELIKSVFTETAEGVFVRFRHTDQSANLKQEALLGKYEYYYDKERNIDIFFIDRTRLEAIDRSTRGVVTNSLAVKILEHLTPYYFLSPWNTHLSRSASLSA